MVVAQTSRQMMNERSGCGIVSMRNGGKRAHAAPALVYKGMTWHIPGADTASALAA